MKKQFLRFGLLLISICSLAQADIDKAGKEPWYWGFDLGWASTSYTGDFKTATETLRNTAGVSHTPVTVGLGFYWPVGEGNTVIGAALRGTSDNFSSGGESLDFQQNMLSFSAVHSFAALPYQGFFVRGDIGLGGVTVRYSGSGSSILSTTKNGIAAGAGLGYGISLSDETRLIFLGSFTYVHAGGEDFTAIGISVGPVF